MKTFIVAALISIAAAASAQDSVLRSTNVSVLQEIERSSVAWSRVIASEEASIKSAETSAVERFGDPRKSMGDLFSEKAAKSLTKKEYLALRRQELLRMKRARDKDIGELSAMIK